MGSVGGGGVEKKEEKGRRKQVSPLLHPPLRKWRRKKDAVDALQSSKAEEEWFLWAGHTLSASVRRK